MEIRARQEGGVVVLSLSGRIDVDSANFIEVIGQCVHDGFSDILCNMEDVEFIDYMGASVIIIAYKEVINNKGRMKFSNLPAHLKNIFSISGLDRALEIHATEDLALKSFKEDKIIERIRKMQLRRRFKRLPMDIKIELKSKNGSASGCLKLDILNLSAVGAYIYGCDKFKLGDEVVLKMKLPPDPQEIELGAKVVWLPDEHIQHQIKPGMGIEFSDLSGPTQQKILEFINRNLSFMSAE
jgi:anti-anti-sigma factor